MSSNGAGRASGHGVGCRGNVISVFAPRRRLMSSQAKFSFHSSRLFQFALELAGKPDESQSELERRLGAL